MGGYGRAALALGSVMCGAWAVAGCGVAGTTLPPASNDKGFACKYVGTPGVDEPEPHVSACPGGTTTDEHDVDEHDFDEHDVDQHDVDVNGSVGVDDDDLSGLLTGAELHAAAWAHDDDHDAAVGCPEHAGSASDDRPWCDGHDQHHGSAVDQQRFGDDSHDHDATVHPGVAGFTDHDNRAAYPATRSRIAIDALSSRL